MVSFGNLTSSAAGGPKARRHAGRAIPAPGLPAGRIEALKAVTHSRQARDPSAQRRRPDELVRIGRAPAGCLSGVVADFVDIGREAASFRAPDEAPPNMLAGFSGCHIAIDRAWRVAGLTRQAAAWLSLGERQSLGLDLRDRMSVPPPLADAIEAGFAMGRPSQVEIAGGAEGDRWFECQVYPYATGAHVIFSDVTEHRLAEQAVESANDLLQGVADALTAEIIVFDEAGVVVSLNAAARASIGALGQLGAPGAVGALYVEVCRQMIPGLEEEVLLRGLDDLIAKKSRTFAHVYAAASSGGSRRRQVRITRFRIGAAVRFIAIHEDQPEVAHAQAALRQTTERLLSAQEDERERIAIELHDSTSQHLVALGLGVTRLRRMLGNGVGTQDVLEDMSTSVKEAMKEIRVFSYLMKPPGLARDGLEATARAFVKGFGLRTELSAGFHAEGALDLVSADIRHTAFRVLQEALSNVYRHAQASSVEVELAHRGGVLTLSIADDGRGISARLDGPQDLAPLGVGISGMRGRVEQLGGELDISGSRNGTAVRARIPTAPARGLAA